MAWWKLLFLCAALAGSTDALKKRILNGQNVKIENYPYQVSIRIWNQHFCGGSIISEKHILTAAHCIYSDMVSPYVGFTVVTGTSNRIKGGRIHNIASIIVHPDYWSDYDTSLNDIAVITLRDTIVFSKYQQKINLPKQNYNVGQKANATGWGFIQDIPIQFRPNKLQMIQTKIISVEECQKKLINPETTKIYDTEICTFHSAGTGLCHGDSGGPLAINGELVGIASWVDGDYCGNGTPDVFTNVYKFIDFIESATNQKV